MMPTSRLSDDDYPADALRAAQQGTTAVVLDVDAKGKVTGCSVSASSGAPSLDAATCRFFPRTLRFQPARDADGKKVASTFATRLNWILPKGAASRK